MQRKKSRKDNKVGSPTYPKTEQIKPLNSARTKKEKTAEKTLSVTLRFNSAKKEKRFKNLCESYFRELEVGKIKADKLNVHHIVTD
jgi:hypothetical protein